MPWLWISKGKFLHRSICAEPTHVRAPKSLTYLRTDDGPSGSLLWESVVHYQMIDNLGDPMPTIGLEVYEWFLLDPTTVVPHWDGMNWEPGTMYSNPSEAPTDVTDNIGRYAVPLIPPPVICSDDHSWERVLHWNGHLNAGYHYTEGSSGSEVPPGSIERGITLVSHYWATPPVVDAIPTVTWELFRGRARHQHWPEDLEEGAFPFSGHAARPSVEVAIRCRSGQRLAL